VLPELDELEPDELELEDDELELEDDEPGPPVGGPQASQIRCGVSF